MEENRKFLKGFVCGAAVMLLAAAAGAGTFLFLSRDKAVKPEHLEKLARLEAVIDRAYLGEKDPQMMAEGMYLGLVAGLGDPYSQYYTAKQYEEARTKVEGAYEGIGVTIQQTRDGKVTFAEIYEDSSAGEAGVLAGDELLKVDEREVAGLSLSEITELIKHGDKEEVVLTIAREGQKEPLEFRVEVRPVEVDQVEYRMLPDRVGYVKIPSFNQLSLEQYEAAIEDLTDRGMEKLLVDLRNNLGGVLDSVCDILNDILPKGIIVYTEDKYGEKNVRESTGERQLEIPLAVLVNESSASASEIFAGAVQDHGVGAVVGTTTYGKGVVQNTWVQEDGSALKLTISQYFTPNGNNIDGVGIEPDLKAELSPKDQERLLEGELPWEEDAQLQKALEWLKAAR